jgi:hypothetical protein
MAKYRNRKATVFNSDEQTRVPVSTILDSADLNGESSKEVMRLRILDADSVEKGPDIEFKIDEVIAGL